MIEKEASTLWPHPPFRMETGSGSIFRIIGQLLKKLSFWREATFIAGMLTIYIVLLFIPLPFASATVARTVIKGAWWPWRIIDALLMGGALSRAGILSVGALGVLATRGQQFPNLIGRVRLGPVNIATGIFITAIPTLVIGVGMLLAGIIQPNPLHVLLNWFILLSGAVFVVVVNIKLERSLRINVITVNALVVVGAYFYSLISVWDTIGISLIGLAAFLFMLTNTIGQRRVKKIQVVDRATAFDEKAYVLIPYSDHYVQYSFLFLLCAGVTFLLVPMSLFSGILLDLQPGTYPNLVLVCSISFGFFALIRRRGFISSFSPRATARYLQENIWIIPGIHPGKETEKVFRREVGGITEYWITLFTSWYIVFWILENVMLRTTRETFLFPSGAMGFLIMLAFGAHFSNNMLERIRSLALRGYDVGDLKEIHFISSRPEIDIGIIERLIDSLPESLRKEVLELLKDSQSETISKTLFKAVLKSLLPSKANSALVRLEVAKTGLFRALIQEIRTAVFYGLGFFLLMLVLLRFVGYKFGAAKLHLVLAVGPVVYTFIFSERTRVILGMIIRRIWSRLTTVVRQIGSSAYFHRKHHGNHREK